MNYPLTLSQCPLFSNNIMSKTFSVMTYNVHSCIGMDGRISPLRIAAVIERYRPDVVALQELDADLIRTDRIDQAKLIAMTLEMSFHFHSSIQIEEGGYGNAVLSRSQVHLVKAGAFPTEPLQPFFERLGALWAEVELEGSNIQVVTTHFGLDRRERNRQAEAITGPEWLGTQSCARQLYFAVISTPSRALWPTVG